MFFQPEYPYSVINQGFITSINVTSSLTPLINMWSDHSEFELAFESSHIPTPPSILPFKFQICHRSFCLYHCCSLYCGRSIPSPLTNYFNSLQYLLSVLLPIDLIVNLILLYLEILRLLAKLNSRK